MGYTPAIIRGLFRVDDDSDILQFNDLMCHKLCLLVEILSHFILKTFKLNDTVNNHLEFLFRIKNMIIKIWISTKNN